MRSTQLRDQLDPSTKLDRIRRRSENDSEMVFNNLGHIINLELLSRCFHSLDGSKAVGIDRVTKEAYHSDLQSNLSDLLLRIRRGSYHPKASRIVEIPKIDGSTRPLAIGCLEDKIVQEAVRRILDAIYDPLFLDCSHGFRPERECDTALVQLDRHLYGSNCGAVIDIDLQKYFNSIPHSKLEEMLKQKISDRRFLWLILKLIKAPTLDENGMESPNEIGVPQGSIVSPVLANIYLHFALDLWFKEINESKFGGTLRMVRYADDGIFVMKTRPAADRFLKLLTERLEAYEIYLNQDKTKVLTCVAAESARCERNNLRSPSFTFLGFLHIWGKSRNSKTGQIFWRVKRRTCPKRFRKKIKEVRDWLSKNRHKPYLFPRIAEKVKGYLAYFAINDNAKKCAQFLNEVRRILHYYLNRRSQRKGMMWEQMGRILIKHGYPTKVRLKNLFFTMNNASKGA
jgi:RNA-directed DNA polymerase